MSHYSRKYQDWWTLVVNSHKIKEIICLLLQKGNILAAVILRVSLLFFPPFTVCLRSLCIKSWRARKLGILILAVGKISRNMTHDWRVTALSGAKSCVCEQILARMGSAHQLIHLTGHTPFSLTAVNAVSWENWRHSTYNTMSHFAYNVNFYCLIYINSPPSNPSFPHSSFYQICNFSFCNSSSVSFCSPASFCHH